MSQDIETEAQMTRNHPSINGKNKKYVSSVSRLSCTVAGVGVFIMGIALKMAASFENAKIVYKGLRLFSPIPPHLKQNPLPGRHPSS